MPTVKANVNGQAPSMFVPDSKVVLAGFLVTMFLTLIGWLTDKWQSRKNAKAEPESAPSKPPSPPAKKLLCLRDSKVYVAVGYGGSGNVEGEIGQDAVFGQEENCIFVEGEKSCVLINGLTGLAAAMDVRDGFNQVIPVKSISTVVVMGVVQSKATQLFMDDLESAPTVMVHQGYERDVDAYNENATALHKLTEKLPRVDAISATEHFSGRHNVTLDGIDFEFVSTGAHNQFFIWLPKQKILVTPDLFDRDYSRTHYFQAKFNTPEMIKMIELAMTFPAETLVPLHKYPVAGSANIAEYLANFKDAIKFSHDQTIQLMNQGYYPDDMLRILKSPRHLSSFLYSANDSLDWRVRSVFNSYLGWFSGKASELHPMDPAEEADGVMKLVRQDSDVIVKQAEKALDEHDDAWALKLSQYLIDAGRRVKEAMALQKKAMRKIRKKSVAMPPMPIANNNATIEEVDEAMEAMDGDLPMEKKLANVSNDELFTILGLNIDAKKAVDMTTSFSVKLTDSAEDEQKEFHFALRNGVLERLTRTPEEPSKVTVRTTEDEWRRLIINRGVGEEERLQQIVTDQNQLAELRSILATFDL